MHIVTAILLHRGQHRPGGGGARGPHAPERPPVTMDYVTTAIVVTVLVILAIGIVINPLLRLRKWLQNPPPGDSPDGDAPKPPGETT
ncbi:hypothetical protein MLAC_45340 [Mycobacterium lacus]|uniref:Uncharacterized protein n=1 Tax=Mycobacterium lacus TaxID=169765 RepID=A0A7I7NRU0_9MYCO|nr:hypothetical protein MLAC_45340 [Mycobacterium lacus]